MASVQGASWTGIASAPKVGMVVETAILEAGADTTTTGVWFDTSDTIALNIRVSGITTGTVQLHGSNAATVPANATGGTALKTQLTADGFFSVDRHEMPRWVKALVSAHTTGTFIIAAKRWRQGL